MDYFSVTILVLITFIFITDRKIKSIEEIRKQNDNITNEVINIKQNMVIVKFDFEKISFKRLQNILKNNKYEYIFMENKMLNLKNGDRDILINNFANNKKRISGFNIRYNTNKKNKTFFKIMYLNILNYLNIFNKNDLTTYGVVILNKKDVNNLVLRGSKVICNNIISYIQSKSFNLLIDIDGIKNDNKTSYLINKIYNSDFKIIIKFLFLVATGYIITSNLIYYIFNISTNFYKFLTSLIVYFCYSYILKYIYVPIGKTRILSTYIFIIFFLIYPFALLYIAFLNNKK